MKELTIRSGDTATDEKIAGWLEEASPDAASRLEELARTTSSKETRKASRRALYLLSQRGVTPPASPSAPPVSTAPPPTETLRAWASAYDGAGNRLFLLILAGEAGGDATVAQILVNDELGVRSVTVERRRLREIPPLMDRLEGRIDDALVVAEIEPDYARQWIEHFRAINFRRSKTTPQGFIDLAPRIGAPARRAESSPVYEHLTMGEDAKSVPTAPEALFELPWFEPWFFAVEDVTPWLGEWLGLDGTTLAASESAEMERKAEIAREAAETLISDHVRSQYIVRLEESADILRRRGRTLEARQALIHAAALKSDTPTRAVPFAEAITARTLTAASEIVAARRREQAASGGGSGE